MTQRITPQMQADLLLANITNDLSAVDRSQQELSTGLQIMAPSDNPYGTVLSMQLSGQISSMNSYTANINDGTAWADTAGTALEDVYQLADSARTLIVEGAGGTLSAPERASVASQIADLVASIKDSANSQYDGMYIFSGSATSTAPYLTGAGANDDFQGNTDAITRTIGPAGTPPLQVNANISSVLNDSSDAPGLLTVLEQAASDVAAGTGANTDLSALDTSISQLEALQGTVGVTQQRLAMATTRISAFRAADQNQLSRTEDVDMASASISYSTEQAAYNAALQTGAQLIQTSLLNFLKA